MSDIIVVTNRKLVEGDFLTRIKNICDQRPKAVILREKDLPFNEYAKLASEVMNICEERSVQFISHTYRVDDITALHSPLHLFERSELPVRGTSVHSVEEAKEAQALGATYLVAGHVFETDCKKGLPGRGLEFIKAVTENVSIPVYAIGGIDPGNFRSVLDAGARGICIMSSAMTCKNVGELFSAF